MGFKRLVGFAGIGALALALSGCYTMKSENVYHSDGTIDFSMTTAIDPTAFGMEEGDTSFADDMTASPEFDDLKKELGDKLTVTPYEADGEVGVTIEMKGVTTEQIAELNDAQETPSGETTITIDNGEIRVDYVMTEEAKQELDESLGTLGEGTDASMLASVITFEARHTFPGDVKETSIGRIDPDNPKSVIIDDFAEMSAATEWHIVAKSGDSSGGILGIDVKWLGIGAVALIVIVGAVIAIVMAGRRGKAAAPVAEAVSPVEPAADAAVTSFVPAPAEAAPSVDTAPAAAPPAADEAPGSADRA